MGMAIFKTSSVYRPSARNSEAQLMTIGDPHNDSMNDEIEGNLGFKSFGMVPEVSFGVEHLATNGSFNPRGSFNLPLDKVVGLNSDGTKTKPSPRSKFAPGDNKPAPAGANFAISPRLKEQLSDNKVLEVKQIGLLKAIHSCRIERQQLYGEERQ